MRLGVGNTLFLLAGYKFSNILNSGKRKSKKGSCKEERTADDRLLPGTQHNVFIMQ